jgi:hypothetical protein
MRPFSALHLARAIRQFHRVHVITITRKQSSRRNVSYGSHADARLDISRIAMLQHFRPRLSRRQYATDISPHDQWIENRSAYQPLDQANQETRVLKLLPSRTSSDTLRCKLEVVSLTSNPEFWALSYAWGDIKPTVILNIEDSQILITKNLATALRALRSTEDPITLWVDAVCINQNDVYERNYQVRLMRQIYTSAIGVKAWLGPEFHGVAEAFRNLTACADRHFHREILFTKSLHFGVIVGLINIFKYPWWQRLWVRHFKMHAWKTLSLTLYPCRLSKKSFWRNM